jgi:NAD(P)-dependent dehydrogenase (short-subunit alcohol dehydrogenase family)
MQLTGKTILIVGASSGIGRAVALKLAHRQNRLILCARREELLQLLAGEIDTLGSRSLVRPCDALIPEQAALAVKQAESHFGAIDAALLNVGAGPAFNLAKCSAAEIRANMALNYTSLVNFLVPLTLRMRASGRGLIAHTNSLAGLLAVPSQGPYCAAKSAAKMLMDSYRLELGTKTLRFVSLYPGFVRTERVEGYDIPMPFSISQEQAAEHMIKGMEGGFRDYLFPAAGRWQIRLAGILPRFLTDWLLMRTFDPAKT